MLTLLIVLIAVLLPCLSNNRAFPCFENAFWWQFGEWYSIMFLTLVEYPIFDIQYPD